MMVSRNDPARRLSYRDRMLGLRAKLREAYNMAYRADVDWNEINAAFKVRHKEIDELRKSQRRIPMTEQEKRDEMSANFALSDAFAMQGWWRTQATYLATVMLAEEAARRAEQMEYPS